MNNPEAAVLSNKLIRAALNEAIKARIKTSDYELTIESASKKGDNFMGIVYRVTCHKSSAQRVAENAANTNLRLIVKVAPESEQRREAFFSRLCFLREIYLFNEVSNQISTDGGN